MLYTNEGTAMRAHKKRRTHRVPLTPRGTHIRGSIGNSWSFSP